MTRHLVKADAVYAMIAERYREDGVPPTVREVMEAFGLASKSAAFYWLRRLVADGRLRQVRGKYLPVAHLDAVRLLRYLWEEADVEVVVAAHDGGKVRDLFRDDDPLAYDIERVLTA